MGGYYNKRINIGLIMNDKEKLFHEIVETVARCTSYTLKDGTQSITAADILGRCRRENVAMARNIAVGMLVAVGFSISTCATMMQRSPPAIRNMMRADTQMQETSMVYRLATRQARTESRNGRGEERQEGREEERKE